MNPVSIFTFIRTKGLNVTVCADSMMFLALVEALKA